MFIPTWLIVIGVILFFVYANSRKKTELTNLDTDTDSSEGLSKLSSYWGHENNMKNLNLSSSETILEKHILDVSKLTDPDDVKREREKLDEALMFSERVWQFVQDIKYYPSWRKNCKEDGKPWWKSETIKTEQLDMVKFEDSKLQKLIGNIDNFKDSNEILEYEFKVNEETFLFFANRALISRDDWSTRADSPLIYIHPVIVFDQNNKLVYQANLEYEAKGDLDYYYRSDLEAFKPNKWVLTLLDIMHKVRKEEVKSTKDLLDGIRNDAKERNKKNFVD